MARLNLTECLHVAGCSTEAAEQARAALETVEHGPLDLDDLSVGHFPPSYDSFRVEWERAAWLNPGSICDEIEAKRDLLRWRLHALLAELEDDPSHEETAVRARSDIASTHTSLGLRLLRNCRLQEAEKSLRQALTINPFDRDAARALGVVLSELPEMHRFSLLAAERQLLARAAPEAIPVEAWFDPRVLRNG